MNQTEKQMIVERLKTYVGRFRSQNQAANSIKGVSSATISQMINSNWELIADDMWRNVANQIGYSKKEWVGVQTRDSEFLNHLLSDSQTDSLVFAIVGNSGTGKTFALRQYSENNKNAFLLQCNEYWNRKMFMQELLSAMGKDYSGYTVGEMMSEVTRSLKAMEKPIVIMDEADKLSDQVLYFFITLYNLLEDCCGLILCATNHLEKRINKGVTLNKKGYNEIKSRIGRRCIPLEGLSKNDIKAICIANGIADQGMIKEVMMDCEGDLRRIKRKVYALKQSLNND